MNAFLLPIIAFVSFAAGLTFAKWQLRTATSKMRQARTDMYRARDNMHAAEAKTRAQFTELLQLCDVIRSPTDQIE